jgi:hypothetical protein
VEDTAAKEAVVVTSAAGLGGVIVDGDTDFVDFFVVFLDFGFLAAEADPTVPSAMLAIAAAAATLFQRDDFISNRLMEMFQLVSTVSSRT